MVGAGAMTNAPNAALLRSDATAIPLGDNTVDLIVTSPPYLSDKMLKQDEAPAVQS